MLAKHPLYQAELTAHDLGILTGVGSVPKPCTSPFKWSPVESNYFLWIFSPVYAPAIREILIHPLLENLHGSKLLEQQKFVLLWRRVDSNHQSQKGGELQSLRLPVTGYSSMDIVLVSRPVRMLCKDSFGTGPLRASQVTVLYLKWNADLHGFIRYGAQTTLSNPNLFSEVEEILKKTRQLRVWDSNPGGFRCSL